MKRKHTLFTVSGIPTLLMILFVLFLLILSLLSLSASKTDLQMSLRSMEQTEQYFAACQTATELCQETDAFVQELCQKESDPEIFYQKLSEVSKHISSAAYEPTSHQISFLIPYSDTQQLHVTLQICFPSETEKPLEILFWNTEIFYVPESTYTQPVYKGGTA